MDSKECARCLLNDSIPGVVIPADGETCSVCTTYDQKWRNWKEKCTELERLFDAARNKKRDYDVLVPLSGGKDSTYVLYLCRKVFQLKCLAVTFDNGFLSEHAKRNITNACTKLGTDHVYFRFDRALIMRLYRIFFLKTGFFCPVCMRGMGVATMRLQEAFRIPLSLSGTSRRTEEHVDTHFFLDGDLNFIENVLREDDLDSEFQVLLRPFGVFRSPARIKLPDFLDWDYRTIYDTITGDLGWTSPEKDAEHTDCAVEPIVQYVRYRKFPAMTPELLRFSKLVTCGQMSKAEARHHVEISSERLTESPPEIGRFIESLDITKQQFEEVLQEPLRHLKYLSKRHPAVRRIA